MFKDTPDGTTHSYEDGCGEPAHNKYCCDWQKQQPTLTVTIDGKCKCGYQYPIKGIHPIE